MIIVKVTWGEFTAFIRDPVRRGDFIAGTLCNEVGIGMRSEGCTEDPEMRIYAPAVRKYEEFVF